MNDVYIPYTSSSFYQQSAFVLDNSVAILVSHQKRERIHALLQCLMVFAVNGLTNLSSLNMTVKEYLLFYITYSRSLIIDIRYGTFIFNFLVQSNPRQPNRDSSSRCSFIIYITHCLLYPTVNSIFFKVPISNQSSILVIVKVK